MQTITHMQGATTMAETRPRKKSGSGDAVSSAKRHVGELSRFSEACLLLADDLPERVSMAQVAFFMYAATADLMGAPTTFSAIRDQLGERGKSIKTTYRIFLEPTRTFPGGLGWLYQTVDPNDNRVRHLHLTQKGAEMAVNLGITLGKD